MTLDVKDCLDECEDSPLCRDLDVEELRIVEDVSPPGFLDLDGEEDDVGEDADRLVRVALDAQGSCPVENGSRVTVSVL